MFSCKNSRIHSKLKQLSSSRKGIIKTLSAPDFNMRINEEDLVEIRYEMHLLLFN